MNIEPAPAAAPLHVEPAPRCPPARSAARIGVGGSARSHAGAGPDDLRDDPIEVVGRGELDQDLALPLPRPDLDPRGQLLREDLLDLRIRRIARRAGPAR